MRFVTFPLHRCQVLRPPRKMTLANLKIWCSKMQPFSGNQRPDLLTSLMHMSLALRLPREMHLSRSCSNVPRLAIVFGNATKPSHLAHFLARCRSPCACHAKPHLNFKMVRACSAFKHFDSGMCFAPQWRALVRHLNFQKCSEAGSLCTCWLRNVLRATMACTFSTSQLPKVLREWCVLYCTFWLRNVLRATTACTSSFSTSQKWTETVSFYHFWLRNVLRATTACYFSSLISQTAPHPPLSEPTFRPSGATNHQKNTVFRDFTTFLRTCIFCLLTFSLLWSSFFFSSLLWLFPPLLFHLSILSEVWLLNFLR